MSFEIMHFRGADKILKSKKMEREVKLTMEYLNDCLFGTFHKRELLRQALEEMDWRPKEDLSILDGRRYSYKGFRKRVAMDGSFASYEYIQDALLRLQIGFDKQKIDMGIVLVTAQRSEKSSLGSTRTLVDQEIDMLYPTISLPVTIVLFDLGIPGTYLEEEGKQTDNEIVDKGNNDKIHSQDTISDEGTIPSKKKQTRKRRHQPVNDLTHEPVGPLQAA
ncbi:MAG: hypothetical protein ACLQBC_06085 [Syntrophales bacterium]